MSSPPASIEEEAGIAEELATAQRSISIAEFFEKNKHMLGFDSGARALVTAVKEAVDNAADACEEANILPDIYVSITEKDNLYEVVIEDNGPGVTKEQLPKIFGKLLYGSRFHVREQSLTADQNVLIERNGEVETVPIGPLCDAYIPVDGECVTSVSDDIRVPTFHRGTHEVTWQPISHAIRHRTRYPTYRIETERGRSVTVTGNHSLFTLTPDGDTAEVEADKLSPGDYVLAPQSLPQPSETTEAVNLLEHLPLETLKDRRLYVYGLEDELLSKIQNGERVRKQPNPDSDRKRTYYRYQGVEILKDSLDYQYLEENFLPAELVRKLGWEEEAADGTIRSYQVGGEPTSIPVSLSLTEEFMSLLGLYVAEGHAGDRQFGLTFGSHEAELIETASLAIESAGGSQTTVEWERNSTRVKGFGSPLAIFLKTVCGDGAANKRIPSFVFRAAPELQRAFIVALYQGDGSNAHPSNSLEYMTVSPTLSRQLSMWWNMHGVMASTERKPSLGGYSDDLTWQHRVKVYGEDVEELEIFETETEFGTQRYKRIPAHLLDDVRVCEVRHSTVPDSIPGLLMGAGIGSSIEFASTYAELIKEAVDGSRIEKPYYAHNLREHGLLDSAGYATSELEEIWERVQSLHGLTDGDVCLLEVSEVRRTEKPEFVYDISVPGDSGSDENFTVINDGALFVKNSRGQQGIGISAAVLYSQLTSGKPARITSRTNGTGEAQYFELIIDTDENEPEIRAEDTTTWDRPHGTRIELEMEANMRARTQLHDYIKQTAVVNPHARLELSEPGLDEPLKFERATDQLPDETEEIRPHPHGVELGTVLKMLQATDSHSVSGFLQNEFTRVGRKTADEIIDGYRDRHFGRELTWEPPGLSSDRSIVEAVTEATSNKGAEATADFAEGIADAVRASGATSHHELAAHVDDVADDVESEYGTTFGDTVRENAVDAAWEVMTTDVSGQLYQLVDDATSSRKDDAVVEGWATRLAEAIVGLDDQRHRLTHTGVTELVARTAKMTADVEDVTIGDTAQENVVEALWDRMVTVDDPVPRVRELADDRDGADALVQGMRSASIMAPPTDCLAPITAELVEAGLRKEYDADFYSATTRDGQVHAGDPFIVEAGIAYGGEMEDEGTVDVLRFANRVPLVYQRGACATTDVLRNIGWRNYGLDQPGGSGLPHGPAVIMVHVASTNVPFTSESKDAVANIPEIEDEIELAVRECARELKTFLNKRRSLEQRREKENVLAKILPRMATKVAAVTDSEPPNIDDALARIMNNVLVNRHSEDGTVTLSVENHSDRGEALEITEILSAEPTDMDGDADVMEMDGEWFLSRELSVDAGETVEFTYHYPSDAAGELVVEGIDDELVTVTEDEA